MSENFPVPDKTLEDQIANCKSQHELTELLRSHQEAKGIQWDNRGTYWPQTLPEAKAPVQESTPEAGRAAQYFEVLYPRGNDRIEISAYTQSEFDAKKAAILAAYGKK